MASKPSTYRRLIVEKLTTNFRDAVIIDTKKICRPHEGEICVKNKYVGVNATDINLTKGRYFVDLFFGVGLEGVGEIVEVGAEVDDFKVGQNVGYISTKLNSYAEYSCIPAADAFVIPEANPDYLVLLVNGMTAAVGLDKGARLVSGETVLITAAAGGTGHIAVQWAKAADCHVIGTCSSEEKEKLLKELGCDRVINYKKEDIGEVLAKEYPKGVNVVWETIGGKVFEDCLKNLAVKGRLLVVGGITGYKEETKQALPKTDLSTLPEQLLLKSAAVQAFLLLQYNECYPTYFKCLREKFESGNLKTIIDNGEKSTGTEFFGLEGVIRGVEHLYSRNNVGKVVVRMF